MWQAVSSFENCSTNVLIKVMGIKALSSANLSFKKSYKVSSLSRLEAPFDAFA